MAGEPVDLLSAAIAMVPAGPWAVAVSGGADSVALLSLLRARTDLQLHVAHLDHQTRGGESALDADFVSQLALQWGIARTTADRGQVEPALSNPPSNVSSRFRALRLELFRQVVAKHGLGGVILAHHADDQAETVLSRLLRGSGYGGLAGMSPRTTLGRLVVLRPLLGVRREALRTYLRGRQQEWREDASNRSDDYQRNRLRRVLAEHPELTDGLLRLSEACRAARRWAAQTAPLLGPSFPVDSLASLPNVLARESAARWLKQRGVTPADLARSPAAIDRLIELARDAASPARQSFAGGLLVRRRRGVIS